MPLKIKVCGMRHLSNVEELVGLSPDYIGFIFYPKSGRYIGTEIPDEILKIIPSSIQKVGVFVDEPFDSLVEKFYKNKLDFVQLHGEELPQYCQRLKSINIPVIKAFSISPEFDFEVVTPYNNVCIYILFDTAGDSRGGTGVKFNWDKLNQFKGDTPFFLSGGIKPEDVTKIKILKHPKFVAVDVNSGFEVQPGIKDISKLSIFMDGIKKGNNL